MNTQLIICLVISALVIAGYVWNKLSVGTVGCLGIVLFSLQAASLQGMFWEISATQT